MISSTLECESARRIHEQLFILEDNPSSSKPKPGAAAPFEATPRRPRSRAPLPRVIYTSGSMIFLVSAADHPFSAQDDEQMLRLNAENLGGFHKIIRAL